MGYGPYYDATGGILHLIALLIFWLIIIWAIGSVLRWSRPNGRMSRHGGPWMMWNQNSALDLLNERYVKGEIQKDEYEQKKKDLMSSM